MDLVTMPLAEAVRLAESGEMRDSSSALAVILAERHLLRIGHNRDLPPFQHRRP
jgi:hypothetical protein